MGYLRRSGNAFTARGIPTAHLPTSLPNTPDHAAPSTNRVKATGLFVAGALVGMFVVSSLQAQSRASSTSNDLMRVHYQVATLGPDTSKGEADVTGDVSHAQSVSAEGALSEGRGGVWYRDGTHRCVRVVERRWERVPCGPTTPSPDPSMDQEDERWCREAHLNHQVVIGSSWGSLSGEGKTQWERLGCNGVVNTGKKQTCDETQGFRYIADWRANAQVVMQSEGEQPLTSRVTCATNYVNAEACLLENVVLDFSFAQPSGGARDASRGFITLDGEFQGKGPNFPSGVHGGALTRRGVLSECEDKWVDDVTFVMSHDDIFNYGHSLADFWTVWITSELFELPWDRMRMINMDGIRGSGPAGNHNRLMVSGQPDFLSPFFDLYRLWFGKGVTKAIDYGRQRMCFRKLLFQPEPGVGHVWADFSLTNACSEKGPSWLYQQYNRHVRQHLFHEDWQTLSRPSRPQVTFLLRKRKLGSNGAAGKVEASRIVANEEEFLSALRSIPDVDVIAHDFSTVPFVEQLRIIQNTSVLVGFHGAGMAHILSLPVGAAQCCAVVEMTTDGYHQLNQFGNFARHLGMPFFRWESRDAARSTAAGTIVDAQAIKELVVQAVKSLPTKADDGGRYVTIRTREATATA